MCLPAARHGDRKEQMRAIRLGSWVDNWVSSASPLLHAARGKLLVVLLFLLGLEINWGLSFFPEIMGIMSNSLQRSACEQYAFLGTH